MKKYVIRFNIDDSQHLSLEFVGPKKELCTYCWGTITYHKGKRKYILYSDFIGLGLESFERSLTKTLRNKLILHKSITKDIGFLWNEYLQDKKEYNFVEVTLENQRFWIGDSYILWESRGRDTWMYNDGAIFMEITPCYKWHSVEPKKYEKYLRYKEFIKKYKPIAIIKIDKDIAIQWLKQVKELRNIIRKNDIIYEKQGGHF
ncbi:MAG: hypothetical protein ACTSUC_00005 [Promethearchaeota archaeon]